MLGVISMTPSDLPSPDIISLEPSSGWDLEAHYEFLWATTGTGTGKINYDFRCGAPGLKTNFNSAGQLHEWDREV